MACGHAEEIYAGIGGFAVVRCRELSPDLDGCARPLLTGAEAAACFEPRGLAGFLAVNRFSDPTVGVEDFSPEFNHLIKHYGARQHLTAGTFISRHEHCL